MGKIAYLILAHSDAEHFKRLVNRLNYNCDFYVHVDKKTDITLYKNKVISNSNVYFLENRFKVYWGGFNMIKATKELLNKALISPIDYQRYVLLSGADYPLVSNEKIHAFFEQNKNIEFLRGFNIRKSNSKNYLNQIKCFYFMDTNKFLARAIKKLTTYIQLKKPYIKTRNGIFDVYFGSQWWAITQNCARECLEIARNNKEIDKYFKYSFSPDEKYFHTLFFNSSFKEKNIDNGAGIFTERGTWRWANIHHIHPSLSKWYSDEDLNEVFLSKKIFIRKVCTSKSTKLLNLIDSENQINITQ